VSKPEDVLPTSSATSTVKLESKREFFEGHAGVETATREFKQPDRNRRLGCVTISGGGYKELIEGCQLLLAGNRLAQARHAEGALVSLGALLDVKSGTDANSVAEKIRGAEEGIKGATKRSEIIKEELAAIIEDQKKDGVPTWATGDGRNPWHEPLEVHEALVFGEDGDDDDDPFTASPDKIQAFNESWELAQDLLDQARGR
jgi:hypothetical protein